ncbi:hypothetical protein EJM73_08570 [Clostridium botulinum]|uniref:hypothetical protein n=1 Tax=Clostridium botulinum TaxID=1491 RepID=UPI001375A7AE|nr:hypothetical protein [Clostridium botulinum]NCI19677.1 hypothetical protein [Clostridium botulinum]NCI35715.1 hypothetical protein [Clostridium botulinum]NCI71572.1 hypothetical protein [Clostridium botulinum]NDI38764.1 hypothetical protein [Clostridium botulinum]HCL4447127.1 hypothetical protein [Clostridium botulinum]
MYIRWSIPHPHYEHLIKNYWAIVDHQIAVVDYELWCKLMSNKENVKLVNNFKNKKECD